MNLIVLYIAAAVVGINDNGPTDYRTAYQRAASGDKPLLVLVTAEWCPPCRTMKSTTIPQLMSKNAFRDFHYATVDLGKEEALARKLIGKRGVPQLIMYEKKDNKWQRRYLRGAQSVATVEAFIAPNKTARTASAVSTVGK